MTAHSIVVYASRYGATREVAHTVADGLGADIADVHDGPDIAPYTLVVLGSPIYSGTFVPAMEHFLRRSAPELATKRIAAFVTAAAEMQVPLGRTDTDDERTWTQNDFALALARRAGGETVAARGFGGRLVVERLTPPDRAALEWLHSFLVQRPLEGFDLLDPAAAHRWGEELRELVDP